MILTEHEARQILNLNPFKRIDSDIAERQFQVILKGFNYLFQENSDIIYIADEVGLGKTYIALGIASLLRHFSSDERRPLYKDLILVPKQNLQYKWVKEINNFIRNNYTFNCNIVKSVLGSPIAECNEHNIHHKLENFHGNFPSYEVFRNTSFSVPTMQGFDWKLKLENTLPEELKVYFRKGRAIFKNDDEIYLKQLFAFLLNISWPEVDCLIVDEAHNFKHGIGNHVSYRNQLVSRVMGRISAEDEEKIFCHFPELKFQIKPKARKLIFLSATPIDNGLYELKNQFDCFLPVHKFQKVEDLEQTLRSQLSSFMIRGVMNIKLKHDGEVSRNMYRHEHRRGNVEKIEEASPQYIDDNLQSIILALLQHKTLKHFKEKNNKSFEIGMLAGFETFKPANADEPEFEDSTDKINKSEDHDLIHGIASSYFEEFDKHLPHPKQDNLIRVLFEGIKKGNKALVFVRRIASVVELERKLDAEIEKWHFSKIERYIKSNPRLNQLKNAFNERHLIFEIDDVLLYLSRKICEYNKSHYAFLIDDEDTNVPLLIHEYLFEIYNSEEESASLNRFRQLVKDHIGLQRIKSELRNLSKDLLDREIEESKFYEDGEEESRSEIVEDSFGYFFSTYFSSKRYIEGFNFRNRVSTKDWYRINIFFLLDQLPALSINYSKLHSADFTARERNDARRMDFLNEKLMDSIIESTDETDKSRIPEIFRKKTFFNYLIDNLLIEEFSCWIKGRGKVTINNLDDFFEDLNSLVEILQGIFRNGSGLLPAYVAECLDKDRFEPLLLDILNSSFPEVITEFKQVLMDFDKIMASNFSGNKSIQRTLYGQNPVVGVSGNHKRDVSRVATQFRMPGFPYVLFTTDVLKEGEDLHLYCQDVYHYGIAWNPSDMEQRTGRIDRINSHSYFQLKEDGKKTFDNSLHVFYPYLADTLEVNQVAKVFRKMNHFINTFYDLSVLQKDTKAPIDEIINEIPKQITSKLSSKYDYHNFTGITISDNSELQRNKGVGYSRDFLEKLMVDLYRLVMKSYTDYYSMPKFNHRNFSIKANINLQGRRAPLEINLIKGHYFDELLISICSIICRSTDLRSTKIRHEIRLFLKEQSLRLEEHGGYLFVESRCELDIIDETLKGVINDVLKVADDLEHKYTSGGDLDV